MPKASWPLVNALESQGANGQEMVPSDKQEDAVAKLCGATVDGSFLVRAPILFHSEIAQQPAR